MMRRTRPCAWRTTAPSRTTNPCWVRSRRRNDTCEAAAPAATLFRNADQFHLEHQGGTRLDPGRRSAIAVGEVCRAYQPGLAAHLHFLPAFRPAPDHAVERKRGRLATLDRAVELRAVHQCAAVMHRHHVSRPRLRSAA